MKKQFDRIWQNILLATSSKKARSWLMGLGTIFFLSLLIFSPKSREISTAGATVALAWFAFQALDNWRDEYQSKRKDHILDNLLNFTIRYSDNFTDCIEWLGVIKYCSDNMSEKKDNDQRLIEYFNTEAKKQGEVLEHRLNKAGHNLIMMRAMIIKGSIRNLLHDLKLNTIIDSCQKEHFKLKEFALFLTDDCHEIEDLNKKNQKFKIIRDIDLKAIDEKWLEHFSQMLAALKEEDKIHTR